MPSSVAKQEIWRQKQLDTFYRTGRPIFAYNHERQNPRHPTDYTIPHIQPIYWFTGATFQIQN